MKCKFIIKPFEVEAELMPGGSFWRVTQDDRLIEVIKHSLFIEKYDPADIDADQMLNDIAKAK